MKFDIDAIDGCARACTIKTTHSTIQTPVFMPVGTVGSVKSLDSYDMTTLLDSKIILANTYHMYLRPGEETVKKFGGLHGFTKYDRSFLTDSGGFQAFSLSDISKADQNGIKFRSHIDGSPHYFTPEKVLDIEYALNSDIMMVLDDLVALPATKDRVKLSIQRTYEWAKRSIEYHAKMKQIEENSKQNIFAIIQGGTDKEFRKISAEGLVSLEGFDGYAIGGLSVGESNEEMYDIVEFTTPFMPKDKPRYLMGVGTPEDLVENVQRGVDMFDCVMPTRNARNGTLFVSYGKVNIKSSRYKLSDEPIDKECGCYTCQRYSLGYMHHLFRAKELTYFRLASLHNLHYYLNLMKEIRKSIIEHKFEEFKKNFYNNRLQ